MKICAIICEYNPFHNGHLYQLNAARELSGADAVLCLMSGNFVQRGEAAILDKYTRARHALQAGADIVVELPTVFATSNAELFAKGALHLLSAIPAVKTLCFGAENANKTAFTLAAKYLNDEPREVSQAIKTLVSKGASYAKARSQAWAGFIPFDLLSSPNNILGLEYTKAILSLGSAIEILPVQRIGSGYKDEAISNSIPSATAIRAAIKEERSLEDGLPDFVLNDLPNALENRLEILEKYALLSRSESDVAEICDCTEGMENALKRVANTNEPLVQTLTSARYTASRIRRIALQNLLGIRESFIRECLHEPLYLRVLAAKKERNDVLSALGEAAFPCLIRAHDEDKLTGAAQKCFEKDRFSDSVYRLLYDLPLSKHSILQ